VEKRDGPPHDRNGCREEISTAKLIEEHKQRIAIVGFGVVGSNSSELLSWGLRC